MKTMRLLVLFCFAIFLGTSVLGQNSSYDFAGYHMRYWKARGRLTGDASNRNQYNGFMVVGNQPGMSIPAEFRIPNKPGSFGNADIYNLGDNYFTNGNCSSQPGINNLDLRDGLPKSGF